MIDARQRVDQPAQDRRGIADQRDLRLVQARRLLAGRHRRGRSARSLVDAPLRAAGSSSRVPTAEHRVGLAPQFAAERQRDAERIAAVEHAAAAPIGQHRRLQHAGELRHFGEASCAPPPQTISTRLGLAEQLRRRAHRVVVDRAARAAAAAARSARPAPRLPQTSMAHSSAAGPGRPLAIARIALATLARRLGRAVDARGMIDQPRDDAGLVADLVQMAEAAADGGRRDLPDQRQHRRVHAVGGEQRRAGIEQARPGHHRIGLRLAGRERRAQRHIGRALFVAGVDDAHAGRRRVEGVEQMVVVHAGQGVDGVEAVREQRRDRGFAGGHLGGRLRLGAFGVWAWRFGMRPRVCRSRPRLSSRRRRLP